MVAMPTATKSDIKLALIRVKTERAKHHILTAEEAARRPVEGIAAFRDSKSNIHFPEPTKTLPIDVLTSAGDAIHNLRSSLDHLAWHLAHWGGNRPKERCGFPIGSSLENYETIKARKVAGMSPEAQNAIDALHPYKGGNDPLWRIHFLDIADKHRELYVLGYRYLWSGLELPGTFGTMTDQPIHFAGLFMGDFDTENKLPFQPPVREVEISKMQPLIPALHELLVFTENLLENFRLLLDF